MAQELVKSILDAHLSSQEEGIFGGFLAELAIFICSNLYNGQKSSSEGIDLEFERDGLRYIVSIKSGPMMQTLSPEASELAGLSASGTSGMKVLKLNGVVRLLIPDVPVGAVAVSVFWIVLMLRLFVQGVPLRVLAQWCHVHPTTVLRWIVGLALALWPRVNQWLVSTGHMKKASVDEKWIKIRK